MDIEKFSVMWGLTTLKKNKFLELKSNKIISIVLNFLRCQPTSWFRDYISLRENVTSIIMNYLFLLEKYKLRLCS